MVLLVGALIIGLEKPRVLITYWSGSQSSRDSGRFGVGLAVIVFTKSVN